MNHEQAFETDRPEAARELTDEELTQMQSGIDDLKDQLFELSRSGQVRIELEPSADGKFSKIRVFDTGTGQEIFYEDQEIIHRLREKRQKQEELLH